ncbi:hypothetical protein PENTCL1PPCAC_26810 [Pristionchus entomophagus]|uniref:Uncharacterized protein n=1 Tax=Pristionchus entomophagus TaxID=358040 RepID=A0AAV5UCG4_9BILA|nr:hypothetical protein PENTCL1PPCAC_26810 [Pristionchus entomophagus]
MAGPKRSSGVRGPRKRGPNKEFSQPYAIPDHDRELAQAVGQVVNDLVSQVAGEPYGDLSRKRSPFLCVLRKFVKDAVQAFHDAAAADFREKNFKRKKRTGPCEEDESPYGLDLVRGLIMAEVEKADRRERARVYSAQKAARKRERKKQEAIEASLAVQYTLWGGMFSDSGSNDEEEENKPVNPFLLLNPTIPAELSDRLDEFSEPKPQSHYSPQLVPPVSSGSDDSDWAIPSRSMTQLQSKQLPTPKAKQMGVVRPWEKPIRNYPIFDRPTVVRGRGRGRGRAVRPPTVRSIIDATMVSSSRMNKDESPMHSHVSLRDANQSMTMEPFFDFREMKFVYRGGCTRGVRGRATRGTKTRTLGSILDDDAERYQEYLMAAAIETSGESASLESYDDMSHTIDEVVKRVNGMSDSELKLNDRERGMKKMGEKRKETRVVKRRMSKPSEEAPSRVKRRKDTLRSPSPIPFILDSSDDEDDDNQESMAIDEDASSTSDIEILDVPKSFFPRKGFP